MLTAVRCHWLPEHHGETHKVSLEQCRACACSGKNPCGYPLPILAKALGDRDPEVVKASATMFSGCPREHAIKANYAWSIDPERAYTRAYGSIFHHGADITVALLGEEAVETEHRYRRNYTLPDGRQAVITSQLDVLYKLNNGCYAIQDYKVVDSVSDSALQRKVPHYVPQFSIQRWILAGLGMQVETVDLHFLTQKKPRKVNLYPDGDPAIASAQLMTLEETELYFDELLPTLLDGLEGTRLPDILTAPTERWRCQGCDVRDVCETLYGRPLPGLSERR